MNPSIHTAQVLPARAVVFLGIAAFHVLLVYAFASGLLATTIKILVPDPPIKVIDVDREKPKPKADDPPPTGPATYIAQRVEPLPDLPPVNLPPDSTAITQPPPPPAGAVSGAPAQLPPPIHLVGQTVLPNSQDYYPPGEIRLGHEGTAEVRSCVNADGRLDGTPTIEASSGRVPLDNAAIRLARDGKYARAMRGDTPVSNCYRFRVTFALR
jgi:TonB family protein